MDNELTRSGTDVLTDALLDSPGLGVFLQRLAVIPAAGRRA